MGSGPKLFGLARVHCTRYSSCLSFPKIAFSLRACPPCFLTQSTVAFDESMRDALSDIAGSPISDWVWLKASLPSSLGGLNLRSASKHVSAAYISSLNQSSDLVARILGHEVLSALHLASSIAALADVAERLDWISLDEIDVPLLQRPLSHCIDEVSFQHLISSSPDIRFKALALSTSIPHAGDWLNVVPSTSLGLHLLDNEFRLCLKYWLGLRQMLFALFARRSVMCMEIIRWAAEGMETALIGMTLSGTHYSQLLSLQLLHQGKRYHL